MGPFHSEGATGTISWVQEPQDFLPLCKIISLLSLATPCSQDLLLGRRTHPASEMQPLAVFAFWLN